MEARMTNQYIKIAFTLAEMSQAVRRRVGCVIVKNGAIISSGHNGTPDGYPDRCEYAVTPDGEECHCANRDEVIKKEKEGCSLVTYPYVIHAESDAILKLIKNQSTANGAEIYITDEPCIECAKMIAQSGVIRVFYARSYRCHDGLELLREVGIEVVKVGGFGI